MGKFIIFAAMILGAGVVAARWADRSVPIAASPSAMAAAQEPAPAASNSRTVTLSRSSDGHFRTEARVDGRRLELIVDTGGIADRIARQRRRAPRYPSDAARLQRQGLHG
jgi:aspartyl protease family protein